MSTETTKGIGEEKTGNGKVNILKARIKGLLGGDQYSKTTALAKSKSISKRNSPNSSTSKVNEEKITKQNLKLFEREIERGRELTRQNQLLKGKLLEFSKGLKEDSTTAESSKDLQKDNSRLKNTIISLKSSLKQMKSKEKLFHGVLEELRKRGIDIVALLTKDGESDENSQRRIKNTSRFFADESRSISLII